MKCSLIFMRKVSNRLTSLEERYKDLSPKDRAGKINKQMLEEFCVGRTEVFAWKQAVKVMEESANVSPINRTENIIRPTHAMEIAKLPEEKHSEAIQEVIAKNLTVKETKAMVQRVLGKEPKPLPSGQFNIIYADPPWQYEVGFLSCSPSSHYQTLSLEEIRNLEVENVKVADKFADDAILFLWATNPMLENALKLMQLWGFTYKTNMVWVKDKIGVGFYFRGQHELLLLGVKGDVHPPDESNRLSSVLNANLREHSQKPEAVYGIIESMYPDEKYLELFARGNHREKWTAWGNEN